MEERINQIEKELALMAQTQKVMSASLERIASTLDTMANFKTEVRILDQSCKTIDKETHEAFKRVYIRVEKLETVNTRLIWLVITPIILAVIGVYVKGAML